MITRLKDEVVAYKQNNIALWEKVEIAKKVIL